MTGSAELELESERGNEMEEFGVLRRAELRRLWPGEAPDFTSWLAKNLSALGDALGLELELRGQQAPVGPVSLGLLAHDLGRDRAVIIENQLEATDHDHLGKLLTFAAGHDAAVVVWIAPEFRDEHRQALDWLNQRTDTNTEFFAVVVEALQIDDSRPAANFRLVASPYDWRKTNVGGSGQKPSTKGEAYRAFFQALIDRLRMQYSFTQARKAQAESGYYFPSGISGSGVSYAFLFAGGGRAQAEMYIDRQDQAWNKWLFEQLHAQRADIEREFGEPFSWERLDHRRASRIAVKRPGSIEDSAETLHEIQDWAIDRLLRFKKIVGPRVAALVATGGPLSLAPDAVDMD
jgi:hypothetical protein